MRPERTEDLFFVADGNGGHVFAKTLDGQTKNIALYRRGQPVDADPVPPNLPAADSAVPVSPSPAAAAPPSSASQAPLAPVPATATNTDKKAARKTAAKTAAPAPAPATGARPQDAPPAQVVRGRRCQPTANGTCAP